MTLITREVYWSLAIIHMNAFFASVEQLDDTSLRGHPVAVTNGGQGTSIFSSFSQGESRPGINFLKISSQFAIILFKL